MAGADELCRPIRGCGVLMLAMFPGLTPLGYVTTAPFGAKNGNPSFHPTHHTANPAHRPCLPSPPALSQMGGGAGCLTSVGWEREPKPGRNRRRVEVRWHAISALKHGVMLKRSHRRTQPSAHAEATSKCEREPLNSEATKAPNGATANIAQWRKPWGSRKHFGLDSPVVGGRNADAGELCRPIRGCGVLVCAMFPGLALLGYGTTAPFGAQNGTSSFHPTHHTANPAHRSC